MIDALGQLLGLAGDEHEVPGLDEAGGAGGEEGRVIKRDVPGQGGDGLAGAALGGQALADLVDHMEIDGDPRLMGNGRKMEDIALHLDSYFFRHIAKPPNCPGRCASS